mgnify:CR=1 FL=1
MLQRSDDKELNKLVSRVKRDEVKIRKIDKRTVAGRKLRKKLDKNIQILQTKFAADRTGENMKRYAGTILNDSIREFDAQLNLAKSSEAGLKWLKYQGGIIPTSSCLLYTSPSPRDATLSRMPSSA